MRLPGTVNTKIKDQTKPVRVLDGGGGYYGRGELAARTVEIPPASSVLRVTATGGRMDDRELALEALDHVSGRLADKYEDWLHVGMALQSVDPSAAMLAGWDAWSRRAPDKYEDGACAKKWASFGKSGYTLGSLVFWAEENGWVPPWKSKADKTSKKAEAAPPPPVNPRDQLISVISVLREEPALARLLLGVLDEAKRGGNSSCAF
jgi:hypothetical protein